MGKTSPVLLIILDGWGVGEKTDNNAIYLADTPNLDEWQSNYPCTTLLAHNGAVGLPEGQMGNSEVGHLNIGAGRVVYQDFTRINRAVETGELASNKTLLSLIDTLKESGKAIHFLGLLSDGGVHSHINHLIAMVKIAASKGFKKVYIHCFMDGRDTPPKSGAGYIDHLQKELQAIGVGKIATISGRYYAMDRDKRWDRVEKAWQTIVDSEGVQEESPEAAMENAYRNGHTDEFIPPVTVCENGRPIAKVADGDAILFFNFRADRARQLTHAFTDSEFKEFPRKKKPVLSSFATCTWYEKSFTLPVLFPPQELHRILGEEISRNGLKQLRIAETEKYAHVTYFFNGGREAVFEGEARIMVESPRDVATYDLKPEMSAEKVTEALINRLENDPFDLIVLNYANGDMVGHTGVLPAVIKACETVDKCLGRLVPFFIEQGGRVIITADHGNADITFDPTTNGPHTAHTLNPVPFMLISPEHKFAKLRSGGALKDISPTILNLLGLEVPSEMEGINLIL